MKFISIIVGAAIFAAPVANAATVTIGASRASAGPNIDGACGNAMRQTSSTSVSISSLGGSGDPCTMTASATVGGGFVGAATTHTILPGGGGTRYGSSANASVTYFIDLDIADDYVYAGPEKITVNFDASGLLKTRFEDALPSLFTTGASALISGFVSLTGSTNNISLQTDRAKFSSESVVSRDDAGPDTDAEVSTGSVPLSVSIITDPRRTLSLTMSIGAATNVVGSTSAFVEALALGNETLSFASDRPVFEVSDGILVDSAALNIFGNRWVDPRIIDPIDPSVVPLPAGMPLLLAGLGAFAMIRRRR